MTTIDYREVPAIVGGDPETRRGIVLTKSIPAKQYGIQTGESVHIAVQKCPHLIILKPSYGLYMMCSNAMMEILEEYSPKIQRFSVDEVLYKLGHESGEQREDENTNDPKFGPSDTDKPCIRI